MADITLSNGTVITEAELATIAFAVKQLIAKESKEPSQYEEVTSLAGLTTLPALLQSGSSFRLVRAAVELLKGADAKEIQLRLSDTAIQWRHDGEETWQDLITVAKLQEPANTAATLANEAAQKADTATTNANEATAKATEATTKADEAAAKATEATTKADEATAKADTATANATEATSKAETATTNANAATVKATEATSKAETATTNANAATVKATDAASKAETATTNANVATVKATEATDVANAAATKATEATAKSTEATANAAEATNAAQTATTNANAATEAMLAKLDALVPSALEVNAPKRITLGNVEPIRIKAQLSPSTVMQNLIYISDNRAVDVGTDGVITPVAKGVSRVHVIPTNNTSLAKTILIEVDHPGLRLTAMSSMRFSESGGLRLT